MNVKLSVLGFIIDGILFPILLQRLPVTPYRLHSKVIFPLVISSYALSSDANLDCLWLCKGPGILKTEGSAGKSNFPSNTDHSFPVKIEKELL